jgi:hypothetical protein
MTLLLRSIRSKTASRRPTWPLRRRSVTLSSRRRATFWTCEQVANPAGSVSQQARRARAAQLDACGIDYAYEGEWVPLRRPCEAREVPS